MKPPNQRSGWTRLMSAWRIGRWLLLGGAVVWLALSYLLQLGGLPPPQSISSGSAADRSVHIRLAGEDYCVPRAYIDAPLDPGLDQRDLFIVALLPDLDARTYQDRNEMRRERGWGRRIQMLVTAVGDPVAGLNQRFNVRHSELGPFVRIGEAFGLVEMVTDERARLGRWEMYVQPDGDVEAGFIQCVFPDDVQYPSCRQIFAVSDRFVVAATYGRSFLSEWRGIALRIERLFEEFRLASDCREDRRD